MKNNDFFRRFGYALAGLHYTLSSERSFRTECAIGAVTAMVLLVLRPGWQWAGLITICAMVVLAMELVNSALEALIDHIHPAIAPAVKNAKDAAAGAVLVASAGSCLVALFMFASLILG
jgi:undecaprenol kinase